MGSDRVGCRVSLLALLATGAGTPIDPPDPVDGVRAAIVAQLDPANYPGRVFTVGVDHATFNGTLALADTASSFASNEPSLVLVPNGATYAERVVRPPQHAGDVYTDVCTIDLDGEPFTLDPADSTDDTWEHRGTGGIIANAILNGKGSKSAVHSGEYSAGADTEYIYYNVTGTQTGTSNDAFSWGVGPGQRIYAYDCQWNGLTGERAVYVHNFPAADLSRTGPAVVVFDGCVLTGRAPGSGSASMTLLEEDSDQADVIYISGGSMPAASGVGYAYLAPATTASWSGAVDAALPYSTSVSPSSITRVMPDALPTPARLAGWLD